jgi:hypothetical protein
MLCSVLDYLFSVLHTFVPDRFSWNLEGTFLPQVENKSNRLKYVRNIFCLKDYRENKAVRKENKARKRK